MGEWVSCHVSLAYIEYEVCICGGLENHEKGGVIEKQNEPRSQVDICNGNEYHRNFSILKWSSKFIGEVNVWQ